MAKHIATEALFIGRARAHNPGDVVPEANIDTYGWRDKVAVEGTVDPTADRRPAPSASKATWVDYVVEAGIATREDAESVTKDELVQLVASTEPATLV